MVGEEADNVAVEPVDERVVGAPDPRGVLRNRLEDRLGVAGRGDERAKDLDDRSLLLAHLIEGAVAALDLRPIGLPLCAKLPKLGPELLDRRGVISHHDAPTLPAGSGESATTI